jgi:hypothetical protein
LWLRERSRLYARLAAWLAGRPPTDETWRQRRARVEGDPARAVELVARVIGRLRDGTRDVAPGGRPARLLVLLHPSKESYNRGSVLGDLLRARLAGDGIETLDLGARFHARGLRFAEFAFDPTGHMAPRGHALAADELRAWWPAAR